MKTHRVASAPQSSLALKTRAPCAAHSITQLPVAMVAQSVAEARCIRMTVR